MRVIYQIRNIHNNKIYVGSAQVWKRRQRKHKERLNKNTHYNTYLQNAWNKYGADSFAFEILEEINTDEELIPAEQKWIDEAKAYDREHGYNVCPTAGSRLGRRQTDETKEKISKAFKGERHPFYGKHLTKEHRRKISESNKGKKAWNKGLKMPDEVVEANRIRNTGKNHPQYGKKRSESVRKKISDTLMGHEISQETREKLRAANTGKKLSENTKQKLRNSSREYNRSRSHLNIEAIREIRRMCKEGTKTQTEIGALFGISQSTVAAIKHHRIWKEE